MDQMSEVDAVPALPALGAVVIGRDEGERLTRSLRSVLGTASPVVYVDSRSRDGSAARARRLGVDAVVELAVPPPCTVARARNAGLAAALALTPALELVQFLDADSELFPQWTAAARAAMAREAGLGAVYGAIHERVPAASWLSRLYHVEFAQFRQVPDQCPGMSVMRVAALRAAGGFVDDLTGYEDREISTRLNRAGWRVRQLAADMARHEVRPASLAAWWRRRLQGGAALGYELSLHPAPPPSVRRAALSACAWGAALPVGGVLVAWLNPAVLPLVPLAYAALFTRIARRVRANGASSRDAALYAAALVVGKVPEALGFARFQWARARRR